MIETYKIVSGKYQPDIDPMLYKSSVHVTRGNDMRLEKSRVKYDLRKFSFLANVNCSLYAIACASVCHLSVVCNVRAPYSGG